MNLGLKTAIVLSGFIGSATAAEVQPRAVLQAVSLVERDNAVEVTLTLDRSVLHKHNVLKDPDRIYIDLLATELDFRVARQIPTRDVPLAQIRVAQSTPSITRVVLDLSAPAGYSLQETAKPPQILIIVQKPMTGTSMTEAPRAAQTRTASVPEPPAIPAPIQKSEPAQIPGVLLGRSAPVAEGKAAPATSPAASMLCHGPTESTLCEWVSLSRRSAEPVIAILETGMGPFTFPPSQIINKAMRILSARRPAMDT